MKAFLQVHTLQRFVNIDADFLKQQTQIWTIFVFSDICLLLQVRPFWGLLRSGCLGCPAYFGFISWFLLCNFHLIFFPPTVALIVSLHCCGQFQRKGSAHLFFLFPVFFLSIAIRALLTFWSSTGETNLLQIQYLLLSWYLTLIPSLKIILRYFS